MLGFMHAVDQLNIPQQRSKVAKKPKREFKASLHRTSLDVLIAALPKLNTEFTSAQMADLTAGSRNTGCRQVTRLVDLGLAKRCGSDAGTPLFKLQQSVAATILKINAYPQPYSQMNMGERNEVRTEMLLDEYRAQLKGVGKVFTSLDLRESVGCIASTAVKRINAMVRLGLVEHYDNAEWVRGKARTYRKTELALLKVKV